MRLTIQYNYLGSKFQFDNRSSKSNCVVQHLGSAKIWQGYYGNKMKLTYKSVVGDQNYQICLEKLSLQISSTFKRISHKYGCFKVDIESESSDKLNEHRQSKHNDDVIMPLMSMTILQKALCLLPGQPVQLTLLSVQLSVRA